MRHPPLGWVLGIRPQESGWWEEKGESTQATWLWANQARSLEDGRGPYCRHQWNQPGQLGLQHHQWRSERRHQRTQFCWSTWGPKESAALINSSEIQEFRRLKFSGQAWPLTSNRSKGRETPCSIVFGWIFFSYRRWHGNTRWFWRGTIKNRSLRALIPNKRNYWGSWSPFWQPKTRKHNPMAIH